MFEQYQMTINGFHCAGIAKAVNEAKTFLDSVDNHQESIDDLSFLQYN